MGGSLPGEVPGIEILEGGVEVVGVEHDRRRDPIVGVSLDDAEYVRDERRWAVLAAREAARLRRGAPRGSQ